MKSVSLGQWRWTHQLVATLGVVTAGGIGVGLGAWFDFRCPFASAGFACAGCGCSRAVTIAFQDGFGAALNQQPTALIFVASLALSLSISMIAVFGPWDRWTSRLLLPKAMFSIVAICAAVNLAYQINLAN